MNEKPMAGKGLHATPELESILVARLCLCVHLSLIMTSLVSLRKAVLLTNMTKSLLMSVLC